MYFYTNYWLVKIFFFIYRYIFNLYVFEKQRFFWKNKGKIEKNEILFSLKNIKQINNIENSVKFEKTLIFFIIRTKITLKWQKIGKNDKKSNIISTKYENYNNCYFKKTFQFLKY